MTLLILGKEISLKLDTGAEVNVIPYATFKKIAGASRIMLRKPKAKLTSYNGQDIPVTAVCNLSCKHKDVTYDLEFYITNMKSSRINCRCMRITEPFLEVKITKRERRTIETLINNFFVKERAFYHFYVFAT